MRSLLNKIPYIIFSYFQYQLNTTDFHNIHCIKHDMFHHGEGNTETKYNECITDEIKNVWIERRNHKNRNQQHYNKQTN